jgi:hypothetical protein
MRGYLVRAGGITHDIELTDLNYGGCGITTQIELERGEAVKVSVLGRGSIDAEVRWYKDGKAGILFEPVTEETRQKIERKAARVAVPGDISLRAVGRSSYRVRVLDLSTDGCKVELVERPSVGDRMLVKFDGIEVLDADVAWVEGYAAGLKFANKFHPAVLDLLLKRLGAG